MELTATQIGELMGGHNKTKQTNALVRTACEGNEYGKLEQQMVKPSQFGRFEGKQGTKRRSRKGLVRTMPNGWVKYNDVTEVEVVAYKV